MSKDKENKLLKEMGRGMAKTMMAKKGMKGYKEGGIATSLKAHAAAPASKAHAMKKGGSVMASKMGAVKTSPKPDGVAIKGKTKGKMVKMAGGGMCK